MKSTISKIESIIKDQKDLSALSLEVEKVLRFYEEHPNYPLDFTKLRSKVMEAYSKVNKSISDLQKLQMEEEK